MIYQVLSNLEDRKVVNIKVTDSNFVQPEITSYMDQGMEWEFFRCSSEEEWYLAYNALAAIPGKSFIEKTGRFTCLDEEINNAISNYETDNSEYKRLLSTEFNLLRLKRNHALYECDWTQLTDAGLTEEKKTEWLEYRQKLRDLPNSCKNPCVAIWPVKPE